MTAQDVIKTQEIASVRIHIERAINKVNNFHLWDSVVPLSLFAVVNQMWSVCAFLCNILLFPLNTELGRALRHTTEFQSI